MNPVLEKILGDQPDTYTVTQITNQGGYANSRILHARKGDLHRIETEQAGIKIIVITRPDLKKAFMLRPDKKLYTEMANSNPPIARVDPFNLEQTRSLAPRNVKIEDLGTDTFDGHPCRKYRISFDQASQVQKVTLWKATDLKDLIVREEQEFLNTKSSFELRDIKFEVSPDLFELPKDYKQVQSNQEMFQRPKNEAN